ncbi:putative mitochondrial hypothetical protein [Leptomonas pyrrhocoris]|uniref:Uncharacterized protein n=1 Tax=Leptomonas pyrrhocoris TaxID=157538 RepID=A0A0M9FSK3_LEPPY|nr:putative mitochondrial hypothetical protein [Leptomonas pyrrhocoris]KPA75195.1 putative mitochondrial hypothetical protein [Leptomonas pyrrhocoris]|eukprot:XP_015653634.1 putative mitochondrial hypothetical protein [Leptomonas pyrrhocoris]
MRALRRFCVGSAIRASTAPVRCIAEESRDRVSRSAVIARWAGSSAADAGNSSEPQGILGKGMTFASGLLRDASPSTRKASSNAAADTTVGDVPWDLCERMDFYVQYNVPSSWHVTELLRDNSIAIQCSPPPPSSSTAGDSAVHGISLNCFAYKQRVKQPDSSKLLHVFLKRFNASVNNSLELVAEGEPPAAATAIKLPCREASDAAAEGAVPAPEDPDGTCQTLAKQLNSAVAEISFTPAPGQSLAHGLCRAFYNSNGRFHYVIVAAVPEEEYGASLDLIVHALASVVESRVEAAAKRT